MRPARVIAILAAVFAAALAASPAGAATLSVVGAPAKVCQLTGQSDWDTGAPTNALTETRNGLQGIDLGFPVESDTGALYFLFGDGVPPGHGIPMEVPPDDALGKTMRTAAPDSKTCLDMTLFGAGQRGTFGHPTVTPAIHQGSFNVPTGGVYVGGKFWAWFWTNHCWLPDNLTPLPATPLVPPAASVHCFEAPGSNSVGRSVMAWATDPQPLAFTQVAGPPATTFLPPPAMPSGFVYVTAARPLPLMRGVDYKLGYEPPVPVFGAPRYRASIPYMALAPQATFGNPTTWKFYAGTGPSGPIWISYAKWQSGHIGSAWSPPAGAEIFANSPNPYSPSGDEQCVGEHSVTWNEALGVWLMLYACGPMQVEARTAPAPWGPWSKPTVILSAITDPSLFCTLFWTVPVSPGMPGACPGKATSWPAALTFGAFYAPYVMSRYTENQSVPGPGNPRQAKIYWLLSPWDPYNVIVMQTTLKLTP
jgi:hypothetical protein